MSRNILRGNSGFKRCRMDTKSACETYLCLVIHPVNLVFSVLFFVLTFTSILGNTLVLITIFFPNKRRMLYRENSVLSNKFLISLAISCSVIGYIISPLSGIQLLTEELRSNLTIERVRRFLHVWILGTTFFLLSSISYDRYTLLTRSHNYHRHMTKRKRFILLCISWIVPFLIPFIRYLNKTVFFAAIVVVMIGTFMILCIVYCFIVAVVRRKEKNVLDPSNNNTQQLNKTNRINSNHQNQSKRSKKRKYVQLTKIVLVLLTCYLLCNAAGVCYFLAVVIKYDFASLYTKEIMLLISELSAQLNSTLTPIVYFAFSSEFRKKFKYIFALKSAGNTNNLTSTELT